MQVTPPQVPTIPVGLSQDAVSKVVPQIQAQAAQPLLQRAIDPSPKSARSQPNKSNRDRARGGDNTPPQSPPTSGRGHSIDIDV